GNVRRADVALRIRGVCPPQRTPESWKSHAGGGAPSLTSLSSAQVWPDNAGMAHAETTLLVAGNGTTVCFLWTIRRAVYCCASGPHHAASDRRGVALSQLLIRRIGFPLRRPQPVDVARVLLRCDACSTGVMPGPSLVRCCAGFVPGCAHHNCCVQGDRLG